MREKQIKDMLWFTSGYTLEWAITIDKDENHWIRGDYLVTKRPQGTSNVKIIRGIGCVWVDSKTKTGSKSYGKPMRSWKPLRVFYF